jgi:hypothetical protein
LFYLPIRSPACRQALAKAGVFHFDFSLYVIQSLFENCSFGIYLKIEN